MVSDLATILAQQAPNVTVHVKSGTNDVQTAAAIATCVAAFGTLAAAIIAFFTARAARTTARSAQRAAEASETTAHDAREALGLATRPHIGTRYQREGRTLVASIANQNQYAAADISIRVQLRDGRVLSDKTDLLAEAPGPNSKSGPYWMARFDDVLTGDPHDMLGKTIDYATVRWWDSQRIVQWEERTTFSPEHGWQQQEDRRAVGQPSRRRSEPLRITARSQRVPVHSQCTSGGTRWPRRHSIWL